MLLFIVVVCWGSEGIALICFVSFCFSCAVRWILQAPRTLMFCNDFQLKMHSRAFHYIVDALGPGDLECSMCVSSSERVCLRASVCVRELMCACARLRYKTIDNTRLRCL